MIAQHLGSLHPYEQALTIALAFGPFVVLGIVIAIRRRAEEREAAEQEAAGSDGDAREGARADVRDENDAADVGRGADVSE